MPVVRCRYSRVSSNPSPRLRIKPTGPESEGGEKTEGLITPTIIVIITNTHQSQPPNPKLPSIHFHKTVLMDRLKCLCCDALSVVQTVSGYSQSPVSGGHHVLSTPLLYFLMGFRDDTNDQGANVKSSAPMVYMRCHFRLISCDDWCDI